MKKFLTVALLVLVCACCLTSCASVEQEIGKKISVAAVEAVAAELAQNGVEYELVTDEEPLDQAALVLEEALGTYLGYEIVNIEE
jgi:predicted small secreted protein